MAIRLEIVQHSDAARLPGGRLPLGEFPPVKVEKVTAAGSAALQAGVRLVSLRNKGDACQVRLNLLADNTQAAAADPKSVELSPGDEFSLALPADAASEEYKLDVR